VEMVGVVVRKGEGDQQQQHEDLFLLHRIL
jgi:hypothetical protein